MGSYNHVLYGSCVLEPFTHRTSARLECMHMVIGVVSLKGGSGKTTSSIFLATCAALKGRGVTLVDADEEQSSLAWARFAELPFETVPAERDSLARQVRSLSESGDVVIDTPPNNREMLMRTAMLADLIVVPVKPTGMDVDRLMPTLELLRDAEATRGALDVAILFTQWDGRRVLSREATEALEGFPLLEARIRALARYEQAFGTVPAYLDEYEQAWKELIDG